MSTATFASDYFGGRIPLGRVFWLYGVVGGFVLSFLLESSKGSALYQVLGVVLLAYLVCWYVAMWRSSANYQGPSSMRVLVRLLVLVPLLGIGLAVALPAIQGKKQPASVVGQPASNFDASTSRLIAVDKSGFDASTARPIIIDQATGREIEITHEQAQALRDTR